MKTYLVLIGILTLFNLKTSSGFTDSVSRNVKVSGPSVQATKGEAWPKPQLQSTYGTQFMVVRPPVFRFQLVRNKCEFLDDALKRYYQILHKAHKLEAVYRKMGKYDFKADNNFIGYLDVLEVDLMAPCEEWPHDEMDESYEIKISAPDSPGKGLLVASTNWGILRGLETFAQLVHPTLDFTALKIRSTLIVDFPRFPYRSVLLDTSRHFVSKKVILQNLDLMAMNKYNVFHWHIVDDQAFPFQSQTFPALSDKGAYHPYTHVYSPEDVREIIEYARLRGIRTVPEFDTPGHTQSWGPAKPGLLTTCSDAYGVPDGTFGPIDPTRSANYVFLEKLFTEIAKTFPDKYIHLGGDEVDFTCWKSNPDVRTFMERMNYTEYNELEEYYMQKLVKIVKSLPGNNSYLVWQEVFDNKVKLDWKTIVHIWKGENVTDELANVTRKGYRTVISACWYLNYISYGIDWADYYKCDPQAFQGTPAQKRLVLGGGPAMWAEYVDSTNLIPRLWPRAAVPAERLWSAANVNSTKEAGPRLEEHRCRLLQRGYSVEPINGPGFCAIT